MPYVGIVLSAIIASAAHANDFRWLEREWISDADSTMTANSESMAKLDDTTYAKWKGQYGRTRWRFDGAAFEFVSPDTDPMHASYSVEPVKGQESELRISEPGYTTLYKLSKTTNGFCVQQKFGSVEPDLSAFPYVECFKPYGPEQADEAGPSN